MVRRLIGKRVIYATWHDKSVSTGWCMETERFWPNGLRPWPHIVDDQTGQSLAVFGPVIPYAEDLYNELRRMNYNFELCWNRLMSLDWNRYENLERK